MRFVAKLRVKLFSTHTTDQKFLDQWVRLDQYSGCLRVVVHYTKEYERVDFHQKPLRKPQWPCDKRTAPRLIAQSQSAGCPRGEGRGLGIHCAGILRTVRTPSTNYALGKFKSSSLSVELGRHLIDRCFFSHQHGVETQFFFFKPPHLCFWINKSSSLAPSHHRSRLQRCRRRNTFAHGANSVSHKAASNILQFAPRLPKRSSSGGDQSRRSVTEDHSTRNRDTSCRISLLKTTEVIFILNWFFKNVLERLSPESGISFCLALEGNFFTSQTVGQSSCPTRTRIWREFPWWQMWATRTPPCEGKTFNISHFILLESNRWVRICFIIY